MLKETFTVVVHVHNNSHSFIGSSCYLASNVDRWKADGSFVGEIPAYGESLHVILQHIPAGELELKLTRGTWQTLSCSKEGRLLPPYIVDVKGDCEINLYIESWRDEFPTSTASPQVKLLAEDFYLPHLDVHRRIWMYLPKDYYTSNKCYPVIYMHDGQHLFDEATAVGRSGPVEWMVDKTINGADNACIVIGIEHPQEITERERQYAVHPYRHITEPLGLTYLQDIVEVVKPYVDREFRTLKDQKHTAMVGSSLGGLITLYAGLRLPQVFGILGVFSPSIWVGKGELHSFFVKKVEEQGQHWKTQKYYFYAGKKEIKRADENSFTSLSTDVEGFMQLVEEQDVLHKIVDINPEGKHGALYWQTAFRRFYHQLPMTFFN